MKIIPLTRRSLTSPTRSRTCQTSSSGPASDAVGLLKILVSRVLGGLDRGVRGRCEVSPSKFMSAPHAFRGNLFPNCGPNCLPGIRLCLAAMLSVVQLSKTDP